MRSPGPSPRAVAAATRALAAGELYPDGGCFYLRKKLSARLKVSPEALVFGNGSDELLVMAIRAFVGPGDEVVIADLANEQSSVRRMAALKLSRTHGKDAVDPLIKITRDDDEGRDPHDPVDCEEHDCANGERLHSSG